MHRVNRIVSQLNINFNQCDSVSNIQKCGKDEITSLDVFSIMNAIFNGGRGGAIDEKALKDQDKLRKVFDKLDLDGSGDLDRSEFAKAARLCSMVITDDEIDRIYSQMAGTKPTISFEQFQSGIESLVDTYQLSFDKFSELSPDKKLVIALWDQYMQNSMASSMFTKKLVANPAMMTLENVDLDRQVHMVFGMISNAFRAIGNEGKLMKRLEKEGQRHFYTFKLNDKHYAAVRKALFETLPVVIGRDYTFYAQMQFEKYWDIIEKSMLKGYESR